MMQRVLILITPEFVGSMACVIAALEDMTSCLEAAVRRDWWQVTIKTLGVLVFAAAAIRLAVKAWRSA